MSQNRTTALASCDYVSNLPFGHYIACVTCSLEKGCLFCCLLAHVLSSGTTTRPDQSGGDLHKRYGFCFTLCLAASLTFMCHLHPRTCRVKILLKVQRFSHKTILEHRNSDKRKCLHIGSVSVWARPVC